MSNRKKKNPTETKRTNVSLDPVVYQAAQDLMRRMVAPSFSNLIARLISEAALKGKP